jgi:hypothetical protein
MPNYDEESRSFDIPKATGRAGYFQVLDSLFNLQKVQEILITPGKIAYRRFRRSEEPEAEVGVDLSTLMPFAVIRSHEVTEVLPNSEIASTVIAQMFAQVHMDGYNPIAFASGHELTFRQWHASTTQVMLPVGEAYGLPFLVDKQLPTESLLLCASFGRKGALVDTVHSYKLAIPWRLR